MIERNEDGVCTVHLQQFCCDEEMHFTLYTEKGRFILVQDNTQPGPLEP